MDHNTLHYVNIDLTNVLGYRTIVNSEAVLTDFTCPDPGPLANVSRDDHEVADCTEMVPYDRQDLNRFCIGIYKDRKNHRCVFKRQCSLLFVNLL